jgi:hypothetical protein
MHAPYSFLRASPAPDANYPPLSSPPPVPPLYLWGAAASGPRVKVPSQLRAAPCHECLYTAPPTTTQRGAFRFFFALRPCPGSSFIAWLLTLKSCGTSIRTSRFIQRQPPLSRHPYPLHLRPLPFSPHLFHEELAGIPQHSTQVHSSGPPRQLAKGVVEGSPHLGWELSVRSQIGVPCIVDKLAGGI